MPLELFTSGWPRAEARRATAHGDRRDQGQAGKGKDKGSKGKDKNGKPGKGKDKGKGKGKPGEGKAGVRGTAGRIAAASGSNSPEDGSNMAMEVQAPVAGAMAAAGAVEPGTPGRTPKARREKGKAAAAIFAATPGTGRTSAQRQKARV